MHNSVASVLSDIRYSRPILCISCPRLGASHVSDDSWFLVAGSVFQDHNVGTKFSITFNLSCSGKPGPPASDSCVRHSCAAFLLRDPWSSELVLSWLPSRHFTGFPDPSDASSGHSRRALQRAQLKLPAKHQPNCPTRWFMTLPPVFPPLRYCSCYGLTWATLPLYL